MNEIRVAHITLSMGVGGIERLILNLCESMKDQNLSFTVVCLDEGGELLKKVNEVGAETIVLKRKPGLDLRLILRLVSIFRNGCFDIVHSHNQACAFYAGIAACLARVPVSVVTEHSRHNTGNNIVRKLEKKIISIIVHRWITVSNELACKAVSEDFLEKRKVDVIVNGVQTQRFPSQGNVLLREIGEDSNLKNKKLVCMVARLVPIKNHEMMLEALAILNRGGEDYGLLLVGDGPCREALMEKAYDLGQSNNVMFMGHRNDIPEVLSCADVFVLCSHSEGLPLALLEACSVGIPVVVTYPSNRAGLIIDGLSGRVSKQTPEGLADAIRECVWSSGASMVMSKAARSNIINEYSLESTVFQYKKLYFSLLSRSGE